MATVQRPNSPNITIRVSDVERDLVEQLCTRSGMGLASMIRSLIYAAAQERLGAKLKPKTSNVRMIPVDDDDAYV